MTWRPSRNLDNALADTAVEIQQQAVAGRAQIPRRWARLKARLLGLQTLAPCNLVAPLPSASAPVPYAQARKLILAAWHQLSPHAAGLLEAFFTDERIHAPIRSNKQGGVSCHSVAASRHPCIHDQLWWPVG